MRCFVCPFAATALLAFSAGLATTTAQVTLPSSDMPARPQSCAQTPSRGGSQSKVIVHMQEPEVVYDAPTGGSSKSLLSRCHQKHCRAAAAGNVAATTSFTPMSFTSGFFGQGFALNGLGVQLAAPQAAGFGAQYFGAQGSDLSALRAFQDLELQMAHVASLQAIRDAETKAYNATLQATQQRIRPYLAGNLLQGVKPDVKAGEADSCCDQIKKDLKEIKDGISSLDGQIKEIKKVCDEIQKKQK